MSRIRDFIANCVGGIGLDGEEGKGRRHVSRSNGAAGVWIPRRRYSPLSLSRFPFRRILNVNPAAALGRRQSARFIQYQARKSL